MTPLFDAGRLAGATEEPGRSPLAGYPIVQPGRDADQAGVLEQPTNLVPQVDSRSAPGGVPVGVDSHGHQHTEAIDRAALHRPASPTSSGQPEPGLPAVSAWRRVNGVYRTRRPALAMILAVFTLIFEVPAVRLLVNGTRGDPVTPSAVLAAIFLVLGLPIFVAGLYGLATRLPPTPTRCARGFGRPRGISRSALCSSSWQHSRRADPVGGLTRSAGWAGRPAGQGGH